jgi:hypothetical protein
MKKLIIILWCVMPASTLLAAPVSRIFQGVTTFNSFATAAVAKEFPVGTSWTLLAEWDADAAPLYMGGTQGQYRLTKLVLTLKGVSGDWTTSSLPNNAAFTLNQGAPGMADSIQFTSGWGPAAHSNPLLGDRQLFSVNLTLTDPSGTAITALAPAPAGVVTQAWSLQATRSYLKIYLSEAGNVSITGSLASEPTDKQAPSVKITSARSLRSRVYTLAARLTDDVRPVRVQYRLRAPGGKAFGKWSSVTLRNKAKTQNWSQRVTLNRLGAWHIQVRAVDADNNASDVQMLRVNRIR